MQWMIWAAVAMWAIDYFGRRKLMLFGKSTSQWKSDHFDQICANE